MHTRRGAQLRPIGVIRSVLKTRGQAPMQGREGAPDAWLELSASDQACGNRKEQG
jgi:hypothetical protein